MHAHVIPERWSAFTGSNAAPSLGDRAGRAWAYPCAAARRLPTLLAGLAEQFD